MGGEATWEDLREDRIIQAAKRAHKEKKVSDYKRFLPLILQRNGRLRRHVDRRKDPNQSCRDEEEAS